MSNISSKLWNLIEMLVRAVFGFIFKIFKIEFSEKQWQSLFQFVKFGLVGVFNTVFSYAINIGCIMIFRQTAMDADMRKYVANAIAFVISVFASFLLNRKFVFELEEGQSRSFGKALLKCYASYFTTGIVLNSFLLFLWVNICGISELIAPLINLIASIPINFILNKLWAFKAENA